MKIYYVNFSLLLLIIITSFLVEEAFCESDIIHIGYQVTLAIPSVYTKGFIGRAFIMESTQVQVQTSSVPKFRAAISVEAAHHVLIQEQEEQEQIIRYYSCSLDIFLGNVRVWNSGHLSRFYTSDICVLHFTHHGDLTLKGGPNSKQTIGWRSGTSGQGVQRLHLLTTGNLVLVDSLNFIKWQSFNFPTDIMLWGQRLSSQTRLTSFPAAAAADIVNSTSLLLFFYSFEIKHDKIALYLNLGKSKYSYWEYQPPSTNQNITFVQLTSNGLEIFNDRNHKFDQITGTTGHGPLRFLALDNSTGNLRLYHYSDQNEKLFEPSYQALNFTCDLPLACDPYGICTSSGSCSCIRLTNYEDQSNCNIKSEGLCGKSRAEMLELRGVVSVLKSVRYEANVGKEECADLCLDDCTCVATQYHHEEMSRSSSTSGECNLYRLARGIKQVEDERAGSRSRSSKVYYMVKVAKGTTLISSSSSSSNHGHGTSTRLAGWVIIVIGVVDGFIILVVLGGLGYYYVIRKRRTTTTL